LLPVACFPFMGSVLERCGLAEDMLDSMGQLFGPIRGGLGYSVIIVGFILGAITGTVAAQVIAMALISMPVMIRYGYNMRYITGVLAASGTCTQLVPPSLVLIVLADQLGKSVGDMYLGAWGPSIFQIMLFAGYTFVLGLFKPDHVPAVPKTALTLTGWPLWKKCLMGIIPSAVLIFVVLGTMMLGLATPTEAGAMGAIGAIVLAAISDHAVRRLYVRARPVQAGPRARGAEDRLDADRLAAVEEMPDGHHPLGGADLRRARHHDAGPGDADRSRRHGRDRRDRARRDP